MSATKFLAIYSSKKKMLRRQIVFAFRIYGELFPEWWMTDEDLINDIPNFVMPGEDYVLVDMCYYWQWDWQVIHAAIDGAIYEKHGVFGILPGDSEGRCAVIDISTGCVERILMADDDLDFIPGKLLVNLPFAEIGDICTFVCAETIICAKAA